MNTPKISIKSIVMLFLLLIMVTGTGITIYNMVKFDNVLADARTMYLCDKNREGLVTFSTLREGFDSIDIQNYLRLVKGETNKIEFKSSAINEPSGFSLKAIDYSLDSILVKIYLERNESTLAKPSQEVHWIWREYLSEFPCNN
jgi:hypothetical protein